MTPVMCIYLCRASPPVDQDTGSLRAVFENLPDLPRVGSLPATAAETIYLYTPWAAALATEKPEEGRLVLDAFSAFLASGELQHNRAAHVLACSHVVPFRVVLSFSAWSRWQSSRCLTEPCTCALCSPLMLRCHACTCMLSHAGLHTLSGLCLDCSMRATGHTRHIASLCCRGGGGSCCCRGDQRPCCRGAH